MADIAAEAGVAVQTVYFTFHNKPAVLRAAFAFAVKGDLLPTSPIERPWFAAMEQEPDHERALAIFVDASTAIFRRVVPLASVFKVLGDDPEMASFYESSGRLQRDGYRIVVDTLARKRPLRTCLSPEDATTILLVLLGTDVYRSMLEDHGWAEQKWRAWVIETLSEALFGRPAAGCRGDGRNLDAVRVSNSSPGAPVWDAWDDPTRPGMRYQSTTISGAHLEHAQIAGGP